VESLALQERLLVNSTNKQQQDFSIKEQKKQKWISGKKENVCLLKVFEVDDVAIAPKQRTYVMLRLCLTTDSKHVMTTFY